MIGIRSITFDLIYPVWSEYLWKGRESPITPSSSMKLDGTNDISIHKKYPVYFCGVYIDGTLAGVNSCHQTGDNEFRSRGIYVFPEYRRLGLSQMLFQFVEDKSFENRCSLIWSLPRINALDSYKKFGFEECSGVINTGVEFGPNIYVKLNLV